MKILAIIPARGGSQGVPNKNILAIDGKPLIAYAIEVANASKKITKTIVSTDSDLIANIAKEFEAEVLIRDSNLATATSNVVETVKSVVETEIAKGNFYDLLVLLQPTAPLRTEKDIDQAIQILIEKKVDAVISTIKVGDNHPARMYKIKDDKMQPYIPKEETKRRQDLEPLYLRNGCIYIVKTKTLLEKNTLMPSNKCAYIMDAKWAVNIDNPIDVVILKHLIVEWKAQKSIK